MRYAVLLFAGALCAHATTYYVTVAGLGGEQEYEQRFSGWAKDLDKELRGSPDSKVDTLFGPDATRAKIQDTLSRISREAKPDDVFVLMLIGHGSYDGVDYKINLPGPDMTASDIAAVIDRIAAKRQLVVNMTSCSGASRALLERPGRTVITATKTGTERNATVFARYWAEALRDPAADTDKNETISALEAFRYAEQKTSDFYNTQKRLATEHAVLDDTGKGEGVRKPSADNGEGLIAARLPLLRTGTAQAAASDPRKSALLAKKDQLEQQIDSLKYQKAALPEDAYKQQLTVLLIELAKTQAELDK